VQHYSNTNQAKKVGLGHLLTAVGNSKSDQNKTGGKKKNRKRSG
jgi:hypothetical protein